MLLRFCKTLYPLQEERERERERERGGGGFSLMLVPFLQRYTLDQVFHILNIHMTQFVISIDNLTSLRA